MEHVDLPTGLVKFSSNHHLQLLRDTADLSESVLPGVEAIGLGYNPFLGYAGVGSGTVQLFDWNNAKKKKVSFKPEFVVPEIVDVQQNDSASYTNISGNTVTEYQRSLAVSVAIEGKYNFFSGSLSTDYDENSLRNAENEFTRIQQSINLWSLRLPSVKSLRDLMLPHMREQLDELDVKNPSAISRFFDRVGSHFLTGIVMGGRAILAASTNKLKVKRDYSVSVIAKASYEGLTGQLSAEARTKYGESMSSFTQYSSTHQEVRGGDGTKAHGVFEGKAGFQAWVDSVGTSPDFVDFVPTIPMLEIWSLCKTDSQAEAMKRHFDTVWAREQSDKYRIKANYIDQLVVITGDSSTIEPPAGYTKIPYDLNAGAKGDFIYLCYHEQAWYPDNTKPAVTAIKIIYDREPVPTGYIKLPQDLNKGAGGADIYLCYKLESYNTDTAINKITVISGNNPDINAPYGYEKVPGDLNKGAKGNFIYACTFVGK
ncbi:MAC/perforin domain-containing protein [Pseudomonas entomophila]|uniref:MAC/perforin domain-containing protein n=1 Tax=Pseudomonas entomophila TaxID=312306 RepID=UPI00200C3A9A|nr:MAC/perforin domain-containing protein [Pseudomonas entomophila]